MCGGSTTKDSTPPSDTGAPTNSHNKDSSSKELSNTPLPIQARRKAEKARGERRRATREERKAYESIDGTEPRRRAELRVTIQRVSGDAMTADLLLSEIEASLGDAWRLDVLEERNGTAQIRVVLDGK